MRAPRRWQYPSAYIGHALQGLIIGLALVGPIPEKPFQKAVRPLDRAQQIAEPPGAS